ncbi:MAG: septal ring lytic transglycosylase RlpA family protein [Gammaproteobacteria bacterium]|nr:MAG: septal ring lytic transglycosylase RlpA family protein [Gammaproteobacteria bacterium]
MQHSHNLAIWILVLFVLSACSSTRPSISDDPPLDVDRTKSQLPADQVPRVEPLSKYGNPSSYVVFGKTYHTLPSSQGFVQRGIASWYGKKFHGRRTSSGEPYDMYGMTAAHTQLPLPTYVQVTNLNNGKQVVLRVNDRGPFHGNRVIDLSYTAATKLDIVKEGTGLVEVRALDPRNYRITHNRVVSASSELDINVESEMVADSSPEIVTEATTISNQGPKIFVQVGAFGEFKNASQLKSQLSGLNLGVVTISSIVKDTKQLHRVRIGPIATVKSADDTVAELIAMGISDHRVVIE